MQDDFFKKTIIMLTKSNYLSGLQCSKLLWVQKNERPRMPLPDMVSRAKLAEGERVGELARGLFDCGVDLSDYDFEENLKKTQDMLRERAPLFEAGFLIDGLFSRADILIPVGEDAWDIVEVKGATKVKDVNIHDVSFQRYVYEKAGLKIGRCFVMHINNKYVRCGNLNVEELFVKEDVTGKVMKFLEGIENRVQGMLDIIDSDDEPSCKIGVHCSDPYVCNLQGECFNAVSEGSVFEFYRIRKKKVFELYHGGIKLMKDVPCDVKLNDKQEIQKSISVDGGVHKNKEKISEFLEGLNYPIYYLDFETINPAIPRFDSSKPYQQIPFQYSLHVQNEPDGEVRHVSFLAEGANDPRVDFMKSLRDNLGEAGDVLVYNQAFEKMVLRQGVDALPEFAFWYADNIFPRVKDLWDVFKNFWYYDSRQKGSASIKAILPLFSDLSYGELDIGKGDVASLEFSRVTYGDVDDEEREKIRKALEKYCEMDTLAEAEIIKGLWEIAK